MRGVQARVKQYVGGKFRRAPTPCEERSIAARRELLSHAGTVASAPVLDGARERKRARKRLLKQRLEDGTTFFEYFRMTDDLSQVSSSFDTTSKSSMANDIDQAITENLRRSSMSPPPTPTPKERNGSEGTDIGDESNRDLEVVGEHASQWLRSVIDDEETGSLTSSLLEKLEATGVARAWIPSQRMPTKHRGAFSTYPVVLQQSNGLRKSPGGVMSTAQPLGLALFGGRYSAMIPSRQSSAPVGVATDGNDAYFDGRRPKEQYSERYRHQAQRSHPTVKGRDAVAFEEISAGLAGRHRSAANLKTKKLGDGHARQRHLYETIMRHVPIDQRENYHRQRLRDYHQQQQSQRRRFGRGDGLEWGSSIGSSSQSRNQNKNSMAMAVFGPSVEDLQRRRLGSRTSTPVVEGGRHRHGDGGHQERKLEVFVVRGESPMNSRPGTGSSNLGAWHQNDNQEGNDNDDSTTASLSFADI